MISKKKTLKILVYSANLLPRQSKPNLFLFIAIRWLTNSVKQEAINQYLI